MEGVSIKYTAKKTFRLEFCQMGFDSIWTLSFFYNVDEKQNIQYWFRIKVGQMKRE